MNRVVITGIGSVTPLGNTFGEAWHGLVFGRSGIGPITKFPSDGLRWRSAGEVKGFESGLSHRERRQLDPFAQYALAAAAMAVEQAGLADAAESYRSAGGVIIGSSRGGISSLEGALQAPAGGKHKRRISPYLMPATTIGMASSAIAQRLGMMGHCMGISNACASGTNAIGEAYRLLKAGYPGCVIVGGADAPLCALGMEGYGATGALSRKTGPQASRPFDRARDGFVLAEGACVMVLESHDEALRRGAPIFGEIVGYGTSSDAFHQTQPDSRGEVRAISAALAEAGIRAEDVSLVNAHATSTVLGDTVEYRSLEGVFGKKSREVPVCAPKASTGHMLGASGAFETAVTAMALREGVVPPTLNLMERDPQCPVNASSEARRADLQTGLSNSFGFGGVNAVIVLRRWEG